MFFKNTFGRLLWKLRIFFHVFLQFFKKVKKWNFPRKTYFWNKWVLLVVHVMSGFYTMKPRHVDESSNRKKQLLNWQSIHASPCSFIKKRLQHRCFPENFARFFRAPILYMINYVIQNRCSKNLAKFTAKFMWTAASNIGENRPCLAGCKFIDVLQNWL